MQHTLLYSSAPAFTNPSDTLRKLGAVTVSAIQTEEKRALTITEIDSSLLSQSANKSLAEVISRESPVFVKSYGMGSMATVSFRGTAPSHTQVKWNGLDINNPMLGQVDFSQIPAWMIESAEILHGGSSLSHGSGGLGGSISLHSHATAKTRKPFLSIAQRTASYGNLGTMVSAGAASDHISGVVRLIYEEAGNNFDFYNTAVLPNQKERQRNAEYNRKGISADMTIKPSVKDKVKQSFWHLYSSRNLPNIMSYEGAGRKEYQKEQETRYSVSWERVNARYRHSLSSGTSFTEMNYLLANKTGMGETTNISSLSEAASLQNSYKMQLTLNNSLKLKADASIDFFRVSTSNKVSNEGYKANRTSADAAASIHYKGRGRLSGFILLRGEISDDKFAPLMPSAGAEFLLFNTPSAEETVIRISLARNYHQPTLNDLYWLPGGNPELRPEKGYTADISFETSGEAHSGIETRSGVEAHSGVEARSGVEAHSGVVARSGIVARSKSDTPAVQESRQAGSFRWNAVITGYISHINDWIIWRPGEFRYWRAENLQEVLARGAEISIKSSYKLPSGIELQSRANWAYTRTTNSQDKQLIYIPINKGNLFISLNYFGYSLQWHSGYTGERFTTSSNEITRHKLPAYTLHNLSIKKEIPLSRKGSISGKRITALLEIENLSDINYQAILWRAMPGRNYSFTLRLDL
jgi:iron complex outermembrane receptor protein